MKESVGASRRQTSRLKLAVVGVGLIGLPISVGVLAARLHLRLSWFEDPYLSFAAGLAAIIVIVRSWKGRTPNYRFDLVQPGVVRSPLGFEVRMSGSRLEYVEGNHVVTWNQSTETSPVGRFELSEREIKGWNEPFANEALTNQRKHQIFKAVLSALMFRQLVHEKKIRPKRG